MDMNLTDKVVIITGGASGIGAETARMFLNEGSKVAVFGRTQSKIESFSESIKKEGYEVFVDTADTKNMKSMELFAEKVVKKYGGIDIWVNNAGIEHYVPLASCDEDKWNEVIDVDLTGVWKGSKIAIPYIAKRGGGSIINLSSFCSLMPTAKNGIYSVAKAGVNALTKVMAAELAPQHIRVNCVIPGFIATDMTVEQIGTIEDMLLQPISMRKFGKPEDIAKGIVFLASDNAGYINGHALVISGGKFLVQNSQDPWNNYMGGY
ncbi:MAG: SDR family NAD(P)-dependent oxidoreductase [Eubacteriales bacterium]|nr:SDR family NAD(P)-dependent oxidoreductase [Eubacteriales bacterium]